MEISPNLVETRLKPYHARVHWRDTMNYAAAIFDDNPLYFDDEQDGGVLVHPMFSVGVTWPDIETIANSPVHCPSCSTVGIISSWRRRCISSE